MNESVNCLADNVMRWSLDHTPGEQGNNNNNHHHGPSIRSFEMRGSGNSSHLSGFINGEGKRDLARDNRGSDTSMFFHPKSDTSSIIGEKDDQVPRLGITPGGAQSFGFRPTINSRGSNEFNPRVLHGSSMKSAMNDQRSFGIVDKGSVMVQSSGGRGSIPDFFPTQLQMSGIGQGGVHLNQGSGSRTGSGMLVSG